MAHLATYSVPSSSSLSSARFSTLLDKEHHIAWSIAFRMQSLPALYASRPIIWPESDPHYVCQDAVSTLKHAYSSGCPSEILQAWLFPC